MKNQQRKVALITGGARRIGACTARYLHDKGIDIILHYNNSSTDALELQHTLCEIREDSVTLIQGELRNISDLKSKIRETITRLGRLDILVNNASAFYPTPLSRAKEDDWDKLNEINLKAPFFLSQTAAPFLKKSKGTIINITDIYAERPLIAHAIYCATKAGLISLTKSLAQELGPDIRVNAVSPGAILWPENDSDEVAQQRMISRTPLKRPGDPVDIASTIYFLAEESGYITGQIVRVDGGRTVSP